MESSPCQQESHQLLKKPCRVIGGPYTATHAGGNHSSHTAKEIGTHHNIRGAINWSHTCPPLSMESLDLTKQPPHVESAGPHSPIFHYLPFTASCIPGPGVNVATPYSVALSLQAQNASGTTLLVQLAVPTQPARPSIHN